MDATDEPTTVLTGTEAARRLRLLGACEEAREWVATQPNWQTVWASCERGDWLLWLLGRQSGERTSAARRLVVKIACECARLALPHVKAGEGRPLAAIELAERWATGDDTVTQADLRAYAAAAAAAYTAAAAAAYTADAAAAYTAADAAAYTAYAYAAAAAAAYTAYAAAAAAYAADAAYVADAADADAAYAADAADAADADAYARMQARRKGWRECADIVRRHVPVAPLL